MKLFDSIAGNLISTKPKRFEGKFSRVGVFPYIINEKLYWQYRPADEVLAPESVESFYDAALTINHPDDDEDPTNCHGAVIDVRPNEADGSIDGTFVVLTDSALSLAKAGSALSPMYDVLLREVSGEFEGHKYDLIQTGIRYSSLGLVNEGRQGDSIKVFYQISKDALNAVATKDTDLMDVPIITVLDSNTEILDTMGKPLNVGNRRTKAPAQGFSKLVEGKKDSLNTKGTLLIKDDVTATVDAPATEVPTDDAAPIAETDTTPVEPAATDETTEAAVTEEVQEAEKPSSELSPDEIKDKIAELNALLNQDVEVDDVSSNASGTADETVSEEVQNESTDAGSDRSDNESANAGGLLQVESPPTPADPDDDDEPIAAESQTPDPVETENPEDEPVAVINSDDGININRDYLDDSISVAYHAVSDLSMTFEDALHIALSSSYALKERILAKAGIVLGDYDDINVAYRVYKQLNPVSSPSAVSTTQSDAAPVKTAPKAQPKPTAPLPFKLGDAMIQPPSPHPRHSGLSGIPNAGSDPEKVLTFDDIE